MTAYVTSTPGVCGGKPCVAGTRMRVIDVLDYLAGGDSVEILVREFRFLTRESIEACIAYGADHGIRSTGGCSVQSIVALVVGNLDRIETEVAEGKKLIALG